MGAGHHSGQEDTSLGNLETHEQHRGQDPARSQDHGERSAKLRSFEAGPTEIVSLSSYSGLGRSSSGDLLEGRRPARGSLVPWQECAECGPSPTPGGRGRSQSSDPPEAAQRAEQETVWSSSLSKLNHWAGAWAQPGDRHPAPRRLSRAGPRWEPDPARPPTGMKARAPEVTSVLPRPRQQGRQTGEERGCRPCLGGGSEAGGGQSQLRPHGPAESCWGVRAAGRTWAVLGSGRAGWVGWWCEVLQGVSWGQDRASLAMIQVTVRSPCGVGGQGRLLAVPETIAKVDEEACGPRAETRCESGRWTWGQGIMRGL